MFEKARLLKKTRILNGMALEPHRKEILHFDNISTIGIVTHAMEFDETVRLDQFIQAMERNRKKVSIISLTGNEQAVTDKLGLPLPEFIYDFVHRKYDLLMDMTGGYDAFGLYMSLASQTKLRVGYQDSTMQGHPIAQKTYDLIIQGAGPMQVDSYIKSMSDILHMIKK